MVMAFSQSSWQDIPKLKNDLRRPAMEEIGSRTTVFNLEGIQGQKTEYINWLLDKCLKKGVKRADVITAHQDGRE